MAEAEASDNPELIGFLANDFDGQYTFSQAAYQWQFRQGAYPGSKNTYRQIVLQKNYCVMQTLSVVGHNLIH
jgi:hypothetical protein